MIRCHILGRDEIRSESLLISNGCSRYCFVCRRRELTLGVCKGAKEMWKIMGKKHNPGIRLTALAVVFVFMVTSVTWTSPAQATPIETTSPPFLPLQNLAIPEEMGSVQKIFLGTRSSGVEKMRGSVDFQHAPMVVLIQDAHAVIDAQENIAKILSHLQKKYGVELTLLEGGKGKLDPDLLKAFPEETSKRKVFAGYEKRAELSGPELVALVRDNAGEYRGMEDGPLYEKNYRAYLEARANQVTLEAAWNDTKRDLDRKRAGLFTPALNEFEDVRENFLSERASLLDLLFYLSGFKEMLKKRPAGKPGYTALPKVIESIGYEKSGKSEALVPQVRKIAEEFKKQYLRSFGVKTEMNFYSKYQAFSTGRMSPGQMLQFLVQIGAEHGVRPRLSTDLKRLLGHAELLSEIKGTRLWEEIRRFLPEVESSLIMAPEQKTLSEKYRKLFLVKDLIDLELCHEDFALFQKEPDAFLRLFKSPGFEGVVKALAPALEFYRTAIARDRIFMDRIDAVLRAGDRTTLSVVAGGFHTEGLEALLRSEGLTYAVVVPRIASLAGAGNYAKVMQGDVSFKSEIRTTCFDGLMRHAAKALVRSLPSGARLMTLKLWRDNLIRELASKNRIAEAGNYLPYIDEMLTDNNEALSAGAKRSQADVLNIVGQDLEKFKNDSLAKIWKAFELQLGAFTDGLAQLVARKDLREETVTALFDPANRTQTSFLAIPQFLERDGFNGPPAGPDLTVKNPAMSLSQSSGAVTVSSPVSNEGLAKKQFGVTVASGNIVVPQLGPGTTSNGPMGALESSSAKPNTSGATQKGGTFRWSDVFAILAAGATSFLAHQTRISNISVSVQYPYARSEIRREEEEKLIEQGFQSIYEEVFVKQGPAGDTRAVYGNSTFSKRLKSFQKRYGLEPFLNVISKNYHIFDDARMRDVVLVHMGYVFGDLIREKKLDLSAQGKFLPFFAEISVRPSEKALFHILTRAMHNPTGKVIYFQNLRLGGMTPAMEGGMKLLLEGHGYSVFEVGAEDLESEAEPGEVAKKIVQRKGYPEAKVILVRLKVSSSPHPGDSDHPEDFQAISPTKIRVLEALSRQTEQAIPVVMADAGTRRTTAAQDRVARFFPAVELLNVNDFGNNENDLDLQNFGFDNLEDLLPPGAVGTEPGCLFKDFSVAQAKALAADHDLWERVMTSRKAPLKLVAALDGLDDANDHIQTYHNAADHLIREGNVRFAKNYIVSFFTVVLKMVLEKLAEAAQLHDQDVLLEANRRADLLVGSIAAAITKYRSYIERASLEEELDALEKSHPQALARYRNLLLAAYNVGLSAEGSSAPAEGHASLQRSESRFTLQEKVRAAMIYAKRSSLGPDEYYRLLPDFVDPAKKVRADLHDERGQRAIDEVTKQLGPEFVRLLGEPGVSTRTAQFVEFAMPVIDKMKAGRGGLTPDQVWNVRMKFREHLGNRQAYRAMWLTSDELDHIRKNEMLSNRSRYLTKWYGGFTDAELSVYQEKHDKARGLAGDDKQGGAQDKKIGSFIEDASDYFDKGVLNDVMARIYMGAMISNTLSVTAYPRIALSAVAKQPHDESGTETKKLYLFRMDVPAIYLLEPNEAYFPKFVSVFADETPTAEYHVVNADTGEVNVFNNLNDPYVEMFAEFQIDPDWVRDISEVLDNPLQLDQEVVDFEYWPYLMERAGKPIPYVAAGLPPEVVYHESGEPAPGGAPVETASPGEARELMLAAASVPEARFTTREFLMRLKAAAPVFKKEFPRDVGVSQGLSLEQHVRFVLTVYKKRAAFFPKTFSSKFYRLLIALHDLGKPRAVLQDLNKKLQHQRSLEAIEENHLYDLFGFSIPERQLATALIGFDPLGEMLSLTYKAQRAGDWVAAAQAMTEAKEKVIAAAGVAHMPVTEFFEMLTQFYIIDAASYPSLRDHVFDEQMNFKSPNYLKFKAMVEAAEAGSRVSSKASPANRSESRSSLRRLNADTPTGENSLKSWQGLLEHGHFVLAGFSKQGFENQGEVSLFVNDLLAQLKTLEPDENWAAVWGADRPDAKIMTIGNAAQIIKQVEPARTVAAVQATSDPAKAVASQEGDDLGFSDAILFVRQEKDALGKTVYGGTKEGIPVGGSRYYLTPTLKAMTVMGGGQITTEEVNYVITQMPKVPVLIFFSRNHAGDPGEFNRWLRAKMVTPEGLQPLSGNAKFFYLVPGFKGTEVEAIGHLLSDKEFAQKVVEESERIYQGSAFSKSATEAAPSSIGRPSGTAATHYDVEIAVNTAAFLLLANFGTFLKERFGAKTLREVLERIRAGEFSDGKDLELLRLLANFSWKFTSGFRKKKAGTPLLDTLVTQAEWMPYRALAKESKARDLEQLQWAAEEMLGQLASRENRSSEARAGSFVWEMDQINEMVRDRALMEEIALKNDERYQREHGRPLVR